MTTKQETKSIEEFYEICRQRKRRMGSGDELWLLLWLAIFELAKLGAKNTVRILMEDVFGRKNLTADEVCEMLGEIKQYLTELNFRFNKHDRLLFELSRTVKDLKESERERLVATVVNTLVEQGWDETRAKKVNGVLDELKKIDHE